MQKATAVRVLICLSAVAALLAIGFGVWVHGPWLRTEHARLDPVHRLLIWSADATLVFWLAWFGVRYGVLGLPRPEDVEKTFASRFLVVSLLAALGTDAVITVLTACEEVPARERAVQVRGEVIGGRATVNGKKAYLTCRFQDQNGAWHESHLQVFLANQPAAVQDAVRLGQFPFPASISYDPRWPPRSWLDDFANEEGNRLHWMSASVLFFQGLFLPLALCYGIWKTEAGPVPLYEILPQWGAVLPFILAAVAKFCEGEF